MTATLDLLERCADAGVRVLFVGRIPALVDHDPPGGGAPFSSFETGAMLLYLAEKTGRLLPTDFRGRHAVLPWLMWQMGGLGPMLGQHGHFRLYATEKIPYAIDRYERETRRLYGVLDGQLGRTGAFVAGDDYSIADMAIYPWIVPHENQKQDLNDFPNVKRWFEAVAARPAVMRAYETKDTLYPQTPTLTELSDEEKAKLFGLKK